MHTPCVRLRAGFALALLIATAATLAHAADSPPLDDDMPPVMTDIKFEPPKAGPPDDPDGAWEEWGESADSKQNSFPRRQRNIEVGMDINTIMGMAMKQPKVALGVLDSHVVPSEAHGQAIVRRFGNQLAAAGLECNTWYVHKGNQIVVRCESIRDGHAAKDFLVRQNEVVRTVLDNVVFTPRPRKADDDDDDDEDAAGDGSDPTAGGGFAKKITSISDEEPGDNGDDDGDEEDDDGIPVAPYVPDDAPPPDIDYSEEKTDL